MKITNMLTMQVLKFIIKQVSDDAKGVQVDLNLPDKTGISHSLFKLGNGIYKTTKWGKNAQSPIFIQNA